MSILYIRDELNERWIPCVESLGSLPDVAITNVQDRDALVYDVVTGKWINGEGGGPSAAVDYVDIPPTVPNEKDDEFNDEVLDGKWTWFNQGNLSTWSEGGKIPDCLYLEHPGWAATKWAGIYQTKPNGAFNLRAKVSWGGYSGDYTRVGIFFGSGSPGQMAALWVGHDMVHCIRAQRFSDPEHWADHYFNAEYDCNKIYLRIGYDGSSYRFYYSDDGRAWIQLGFITSLGFTPTVIGLGIDKIFQPAGYDNSVGIFDWFRVTSGSGV